MVCHRMKDPAAAMQDFGDSKIIVTLKTSWMFNASLLEGDH
jgi:hypothetical protein